MLKTLLGVRSRTTIAPLALYLSAIALAACSASQSITNLDPVASGKSYQAQYQSSDQSLAMKITPVAEVLNRNKCLRPEASPIAPTKWVEQEFLSSGDLVDVAIGTDETFSGKYEISQDGTLKLRDLVSVRALGRTVTEVEKAISEAMAAGNFYRSKPQVSVRLADYGNARLFVSGAVFEPGAVTLGGSAASSNDNTRVQAIGAATEGRLLTRAIQNAGGVRPDADLSRIVLTRRNSKTIFDLRPVIIGGAFADAVLLQGDQITVPSRGCFQSELMVPSAVSPVGVKVFMSNLTEPAISNANSAINKDTREMRYGTRFLQAVVSMNCVGGSKATNASRAAVLYSRNPITGKSVVIERKLEDLVRNANRDDYDPFILPNDAIACYDSTVTDVEKIAQGFGIVGSSIIIGRGL